MLRRTLLAACTVAIALPVTALPAQAQSAPIAAIGDSYMAGIGAGDYVDSDGCRRSVRSYAADASRRTGDVLVDASCPGARIPQVLEQSNAVPADASVVLIQVGGNDIGFGELAAACLLPFAANCLPEIARAQERLPEVTRGLVDIAASARGRAPDARVVMAGYPRLLANPQQCASTLAGRLLDSAEISAINRLQARLDSAIRDAARTAGARYADWPRSVDQHSLCSPQPWFVAFGTGALSDALHPTASAYAAMGREISRVLRR